MITAPDYGDLVAAAAGADLPRPAHPAPGRPRGRAAPRRPAGAHHQRRARLGAGAAGAVHRRPGLQRRAAVRARGLHRGLPGRDRADAGAGSRGAAARPRAGLPRRRTSTGCSSAMDGYLAYVEQVAADSHAAGLTAAGGRAEARGQPVRATGRRPSGSSATCTARTPSSTTAPTSGPASPCPGCGRTWSPSTAARSPATHERRLAGWSPGTRPDGVSVILSDGPVPVSKELPDDGVAFHEVWNTEGAPARIAPSRRASRPSGPSPYPRRRAAPRSGSTSSRPGTSTSGACSRRCTGPRRSTTGSCSRARSPWSSTTPR